MKLVLIVSLLHPRQASGRLQLMARSLGVRGPSSGDYSSPVTSSSIKRQRPIQPWARGNCPVQIKSGNDSERLQKPCFKHVDWRRLIASLIFNYFQVIYPPSKPRGSVYCMWMWGRRDDWTVNTDLIVNIFPWLKKKLKEIMGTVWLMSVITTITWRDKHDKYYIIGIQTVDWIP